MNLTTSKLLAETREGTVEGNMSALAHGRTVENQLET
jgi:hypothetical protein